MIQTKNFFIIGLRRSLTSILRTLIEKHPHVHTVLFEPHDLWAAVDLFHFKRMMRNPKNNNWVSYQINYFNSLGGKLWGGAKFALNPGTKALEWKWLPKVFPGAHFIFVKRDIEKTWRSVLKEDKDSVRGIIDQRAYTILAEKLIGEFYDYNSKNKMTSCIISAEKLIDNADGELMKAWACLGVKPLTGLNKYMKKPENG